MEMSKFEGHTPGPWKLTNANLYPSTEDWCKHVVEEDRELGFVLAHINNDTFGAGEANARLITAAPGLLREVQEAGKLIAEFVENTERLERERDELTKRLAVNHLALGDAIRERDELRDASAELKEQLASVNRLVDEWKKQRDALLEACKSALLSASPNLFNHPAMCEAWDNMQAAIALCEKGQKP